MYALLQYAENYCWSQDTYYVQDDVHVANIPEEERYSPERKLSYYKWVPFFLLLQAAFFRFPSILWNYLSLNSGRQYSFFLNNTILLVYSYFFLRMLTISG